ncbi:hypothetical protein [Vibrio phage XZ1]|nr:hypothetical protein Va3_146 [Vibrio phage Va3]QNJ54725.1 hypothetical protein vBValMR10Z_185 [Vibrio phage vB_ValM_R10Z]QNJ55112.1 hypothetical protein vBValMR11Z_186 [Vibrio phage vB_ValM_R11Z]UOL51161.1 hypothetical protein [Vibrio phage XZ1]
MNKLETAFAEHNAVQVPVEKPREFYTPCGVKFTTEPMFNTATGKYDSILYSFDTGEKIIVDDELDSFHEAYQEFTGKTFMAIQEPIVI